MGNRKQPKFNCGEWGYLKLNQIKATQHNLNKIIRIESSQIKKSDIHYFAILHIQYSISKSISATGLA